MPRLVFAILTILLALVVGQAADAALPEHSSGQESTLDGSFVHETLVDQTGVHRYAVFIPPGYAPDRKWPVILFLHGAGERGLDGQKQLEVGLGPLVRTFPQKYPAIIVFPQVEETQERILTAWAPGNPDGQRALNILREVERRFSIDPNRRILAGWSMGGFGVWQQSANASPGFWSAAIALSGGAEAVDLSKLPPDLPLWALHGTEDRIVPIERMRDAVSAARQLDRKVTATELPGLGHDISAIVFGRDEVRDWMLNPSLIRPETLSWSEDELQRLARENAVPDPPFRPTTRVSRAIALRITNDAFREFADGIPASLSPDRLQGKVSDFQQSVAWGGTTIDVRIHGIEWTTEVEKVEIEAIESERLSIRVALRNLRLRAAGGRLHGGGYEATCGPFDVILGKWRPVWVAVSTRPRVVQGEVQLTEQAISFTMEDDNWIVTEPAMATATGPGLTPDLVKTGVVGGMYRAKEKVQEAVRELIPPLIERIEKRLKVAPPESIAAMLWPMPTAPPRTELLAEGIRTDRHGVSVTIGLSVEGPMRRCPHPPFSCPEPISDFTVPAASVGIAPGLFQALSSEFIGTDFARIDLRDAPASGLARLSDPQFLATVDSRLDAAESAGELRTVLTLEEPFRMTFADDDRASGRLRLKLVAPDVRLTVSRRPLDRSSAWERCLTTRVAVEQALEIALGESTATGRRVNVRWLPDPLITGHTTFEGDLAKSGPRGPDLMIEEFRSAWKAWTAGSGDYSVVEDLAVSGARLRLESTPLRGERVWLDFVPVPKANR